MTELILVINPNSNSTITAGIDIALNPFRLKNGPKIECLTLSEGPFGIESQLDSDKVILPLANLVSVRNDASAFIIACYSDPGLDTCRSVTSMPVFGIQESGILTAMARADLFGVIAISEASIQRHRLLMRRMGVLGRLTQELALNISVDQSANGDDTLFRLVEVGQKLKDTGAGTIILGCAGMSSHRKALESELAIPIIDPTQAAVSLALGAILTKN